MENVNNTINETTTNKRLRRQATSSKPDREIPDICDNDYEKYQTCWRRSQRNSGFMGDLTAQTAVVDMTHGDEVVPN